MPPRRVSPRPQLALGRAISAMRAERGLSQEQVALDAGMEPSWLSRIETGRHNPSWATVQRIAAALGVRVSELALRAEHLEDDQEGDAVASGSSAS